LLLAPPDVLAFPLMFSLFLIFCSCILSYIFNKISAGEEEEGENTAKTKGQEGGEFFDAAQGHEVDPANNL